jgi:hypothetical protein
MSNNDQKTYWLDQPENRNKILNGLIVATILATIPDILSLFNFLYQTHPYTEVEKIPVFYGLYASAAFLMVIFVAKTLQPLLTRGEDYYD